MRVLLFPMTTLYRYFDSAGVLLYVGITSAWHLRLKGHQARSPWWSRAANITLVHFATQEEAVAAERTAISNEHPLYNRAHSRLTREGWGSGSVFQRRSNGQWLAAIVVPGSSKRRSRVAKSREEAEDRLEELRAAVIAEFSA